MLFLLWFQVKPSLFFYVFTSRSHLVFTPLGVFRFLVFSAISLPFRMNIYIYRVNLTEYQ